MKSAGRPLESALEVVPDVWSIRNRAFTSNTYVCRLEDNAGCLVIDPGLDHEALDRALARLRVRPAAVFCTHGHFDHLGGAARLKDAFDATLHIHAAERKVVQTANFTMMICKVEGRIKVPQFDVEAADGSRYLSGADEVRFLHTPGHTPGSSFVCWRDCIFTGDTLYRDSVGLVSFPGEDASRLKQSLSRVWSLVPDASMICPGHGGAGRFSGIKRDNTALREFLGLTATAPHG